MRHHRTVGGVTLLAVLLLGSASGCADRPAVGPAPASPNGSSAAPATTAAAVDPVTLIGIWNVAATADGSGGVLRLAADDLLWSGPCGVLLGQWRAAPVGLFVAAVTGSSGCPTGEAAAPPWLKAAASFRVDGEDRVLLDDRARPVVRLRPGGRMPAVPNIAPEQVEPPVVTDEARRAYAPAAALPAGLRPAGPDALLGRWRPVDGGEGAYVEFVGGGQWRGSDGCNGQGGRWVAGDGGALLATSGVSTLIGCDSVPVAGWLGGARRAGLDGEVLVLFDGQGKELGRLRADG